MQNQRTVWAFKKGKGKSHIAIGSWKVSNEPTLFIHELHVGPITEDLSHTTTIVFERGAATVPEDAGASYDETDIALRGVYLYERKDLDRSASQVIFDFVERHFSERDLQAVEDMLHKIDVAKLGIYSCVGLVRSTARARRGLPSWRIAYSACQRRLESLGVDPKKMFVGM